jgi:DNA mismatch endonuclease, patch repair protein
VLSIRSRAPRASSAAVRRLMVATKSRDSQPELELRRCLHALGLRYRINVRPEVDVRCKADLVFRRHRLCIFVDGCFWHGCPKHFVPPRTNRDWWVEKIMDNRVRDRRQARILGLRGWRVFRVWEHDLSSSERVAECACKILRSLGRRD